MVGVIGGVAISAIAARIVQGRVRRGLFLRKRPARRCPRCAGFGIVRCPLCSGESVCVSTYLYSESEKRIPVFVFSLLDMALTEF